MNAVPYKEEICSLFYRVWYDPEYQFYFGSQYRTPFTVNDGTSGDQSNWHDFVSLDHEGNILGVINYQCDFDVGLAYRFGAINFSADKYTFGRDLRQAIEDVFLKFGMNTLEFSVIRGNPVERSYDNIIKRIGGKILCVRHNRAKLLSGVLCDDKLYEVTREDFLAHYRKRGEHHAKAKA